jgi:hypothetical protein
VEALADQWRRGEINHEPGTNSRADVDLLAFA